MKSFLLRAPAEPFRIADEPADDAFDGPPEQRALSFRPLPPEPDACVRAPLARATTLPPMPGAAAPRLDGEDPAALVFATPAPPSAGAAAPAVPPRAHHRGIVALVALGALVAAVTNTLRPAALPDGPAPPPSATATAPAPSATRQPRTRTTRPAARRRGHRRPRRPAPSRAARRRAEHRGPAARTPVATATPTPAAPAARSAQTAPARPAPRTVRPVPAAEFGFEQG